MPNNITALYREKVVPQLIRQYQWGATSSWMENNAIGVDYRGGKYVTMQEISTDGLGNYDRNLGYPRGNITGAKKQYELTMDRGRDFLVDSADNDETGFLLTAANVAMEFQQSKVIPEVDCYRYSRIHTLLKAYDSTKINNDAIPTDGITNLLLDDIATIRDSFGAVPLVITMSGITQKYFGRDFTRNLDYVNFARGALHTKVKALDGDPIMIVPSARLKTAYTFYDGVTAGQTAGGFVAAEGAKDMKWIITPITGPIAVGKIDKARVFDPETFQQADAWKFDYRLYHDLWMTDRALDATFIRTGTLTEPEA